MLIVGTGRSLGVMSADMTNYRDDVSAVIYIFIYNQSKSTKDGIV